MNNITYFIHSILAIYIYVQCSAVQCSAVQCIALHCSVIHYSKFQFSSGKCTALHLRAFHYNTHRDLHQSALDSFFSFSIKSTLSNMYEHSTEQNIFMQQEAKHIFRKAVYYCYIYIYITRDLTALPTAVQCCIEQGKQCSPVHCSARQISNFLYSEVQ